MTSQISPGTVPPRPNEKQCRARLRNHLRQFLVGMLLASCVSAALADEVGRHSTRSPTRGEITRMSTTEVVVKPRSGPAISIPVADVARLRFDDEPPNLNLARNSEENGSLQRALDGFLKARDEYNGGNERLKTEVEFLIARTTAGIAMSDSSRLAKAAELLQAFRAANANNVRYFEATSLLGEVRLQQNDPDGAREQFGQLADVPVKSYRMAAAIAEARALLVDNRLEQALAKFDSVASLSVERSVEESRQLEALLGKATCLHRMQQFGEAIEVLQTALDRTSKADARIQAEAYLRQGDCYRQQNRTKEALFAYLHVDLLFDAQKSHHAEALFHLSRLWNDSGHADRAAETRSRLSSRYPDSEWARRTNGG